MTARRRDCGRGVTHTHTHTRARGSFCSAPCSHLFVGRHGMRSTMEPARAVVRPGADRVQLPEPSESAAAVPVCRGARPVLRPSSPPGGAGPHAGKGSCKGRMRGIHTSLGTSLGNHIVPQLEHIHSHCKRAQNGLPEAVPELSSVPAGIQGAHGSALSSFLLRQSLYFCPPFLREEQRVFC